MDEFDLDVDVQIEDVDTEAEDGGLELEVFPEVEKYSEFEETDRKSLLDNLEDADLFVNNHPGEYHYLESADGKSAWGSLELTEDGVMLASLNFTPEPFLK